MKSRLPYLLVVLAGSSGRFLSRGYKLPKYLLEIDGTPVFEWVARSFDLRSFELIFLANDEALENKSFGLKKRLTERFPNAAILSTAKNLKGPSWSITRADLSELDLDRACVISYCDAISLFDSNSMARRLMSASGNHSEFVGFRGGHHPVTRTDAKFAYMRVNRGRVCDVSEKIPFGNEPAGEWASTGIYSFSSVAFMLEALNKQIENRNNYAGEFYTSLCATALGEMKASPSCVEADAFIDLGSPAAFVSFRALFEGFKKEPVAQQEAAYPSLILAAGRGERFRRVGFVSKVGARIGEVTLLEQTAQLSRLLDLSHSPTVLAVSDSDSAAMRDSRDRTVSILDPSISSIRPVKVGTTSSSVETLALSLGSLTHESGPFHCLSIDLAFNPAEVGQELVKMDLGDDYMVIWCAQPSSFELAHPEQFSWVRLRDSGEVLELLIKPTLVAEESMVVLGNFTFSDSKTVERFARKALGLVKPEAPELHVESLAVHYQAEGVQVFGLPLEGWVSFGTPEQLSSANYYLGAIAALTEKRMATS